MHIPVWVTLLALLLGVAVLALFYPDQFPPDVSSLLAAQRPDIEKAGTSGSGSSLP